MIDLNYKPKKQKTENDFPPCVQILILAVFSAVLAYMILCGIAGEIL